MSNIENNENITNDIQKVIKRGRPLKTDTSEKFWIPGNEHVTNYYKNYYKIHKEEMLKKVICPGCSKQYASMKAAKHLKSQYHIKRANKISLDIIA
jgi:hypothetical protein